MRFTNWLLALAVLLVVVHGCADVEPIDEVQASLNDPGVVPGDDPSPDAVTLSWDFTPDGTSRTGLPIRVENRWHVPVDITIAAVSVDGVERPMSRDLAKFELNAHVERNVEIAVADLPMQLIDAGVNTLVMASHVGPDGQRRFSFLAPVWVAHRADFRSAVVRTTEQEAEANATLGNAELAAHLAQRNGRLIRDTERGPEVINVEDLATKRITGRTSVVTGALGNPNFDADDPPPQAIEPQFIEKVSATFCVRVLAAYSDLGLGEDFLTGTTGGFPWAYEPARFMYFGIIKSDSSWLNLVYLDANGCTPSWSPPVGNYTAYLTPAINNLSGVRINVYATDAHTSTSSTVAFGITSAGTINLDMGGLSTLNSVAVAASTAVFRQLGAFVAGGAAGLTTVHVEQNCNNNGQGSACYTPSTSVPPVPTRTVWLGNDPTVNGVPGNPKGFKKFTFLHELGHAIQDGRHGLWTSSYSDTVNVPGCQCTHVTSSNQDHCLQSREHIRAAQTEGFGHFFASDVLNDGAQSNCTFNYYKEFLENGASVENPTLPPVPKSCITQVRWLEALHPNASGVPTSCLMADRGVEWDWMNFYWSLRNKVSPYSYAQIASVYTQTCGGTCTNMTLSTAFNFSNLQTAANTVFGLTSARALHWSSNGDNFGVDH